MSETPTSSTSPAVTTTPKSGNLLDELNRVHDAMLEGTLTERASADVTSPTDRKVLETVNELLEAATAAGMRTQSAWKASGTATMQVDLNRVITGANPATLELVKKNLGAFQKAFPHANFSNLIGTQIDVFHKDPEFQKRLLADPSNLPHRAEIQVGHLHFSLNISAMYDAAGNHIGANLDWSDMTERVEELERQRQMANNLNRITEALHRSQAVIEFELDGTIITANDNFLSVLGYRQEEIQGKHHGMFVDAAYRSSNAYRDFWNELARGQYQAGEYERFDKSGKSVWIQASYNPILDADGKPFKVIKFASDITERKKKEQELARFATDLGDTLSKVAERDLTVRMDSDVAGDLAVAQNNLNQTLDTLQEALSGVADVTGQIATSSRQISQGTSQVAEGASSQASSIEEISASLEEMSAMTSQTADNAMQASSTANSAADSVSRGTQTMQDMQAAIQAIKDSSTETAKIVKTIDEISFQTNMLALNAAVEAARAGDAGKGFAVVAEEVRALAQRSAEAAKTTAQLIEESSRNATNGVEITGAVQSVLEEINDSTLKVKDLLAEMAAAAKEQAVGINEVNTAVDQMNKVTQENAANSEQSSAAVDELDTQISRLTQLVSTFVISQAGGMQSSPAPALRQPKAAAPKVTRAPRAHKPQEVFPLDDDELADF